MSRERTWTGCTCAMIPCNVRTPCSYLRRMRFCARYLGGVRACDCRSAPGGVCVVDQKQRAAGSRDKSPDRGRHQLDTPTRPRLTILSSSSHLARSHVCTRRTVARLRRCVPSPAFAPPQIPISVVSAAGRRAFSRSAARQNYEATIQNLLIHKDTRVLCQGITGKTVRVCCPLAEAMKLTILCAGHIPRQGGFGVWY